MRRCVLIVDDEQAFADVVSELLQEEGYSVVRAYDGLTAINLLAAEKVSPDLMLCDVMLPGLSGDRLAAEVRRRFPTRRLPILLLSAGADPHIQLRDVCFRAKPFDLAELLTTVERLIDRSSPPSAPTPARARRC